MRVLINETAVVDVGWFERTLGPYTLVATLVGQALALVVGALDSHALLALAVVATGWVGLRAIPANIEWAATRKALAGKFEFWDGVE